MYSWFLLFNFCKRIVRIMININNIIKVIRICGVFVICLRKFLNMVLKLIVVGVIKSVFDVKVLKNVFLNFMWFFLVLLIF